ncbi:MAG: tRNA guanosine(34) transglycosylase Tgt [Candidatus Nanoarchaeia archaeon]|nr:tRNA guanosine(34) transglycosylase Tgt [Candidatus Nanoarchaeia archaeon]MDD5741636.1 tRNA guanosine(34) transglycosylase Tgt [Candidatus Nanoarchaeia archaeon]
MVFKITHKDKKTKARIGILHTKKGNIETPFFMPVATKATAKFINPGKLIESGAKAIISNALILSLKPGSKIIKKLGGIGKFMNFLGINFTDSGGFQMYSPSTYISSNNQGVFFRNPFNGEKIFITPEKDMEIQLDINSDVAMCLDRMPLFKDSKKEIENAVILTTTWAKRCKEHHDELQKKIPKEKRQLLFGITQGGIHKDLRKRSINELKKLDFDGYSVGGLGLGEKRKDEMKMIELQKSILPDNKPIYLMGIGDPVEILDAISKGIDIFDSRMPTQNARRGTLFTSNRKLKILNKKYESDKSPIDKNCTCFVCKNYSRAYIKFLLSQDEPVGKELASYHNLYYLQNLMKEAKIAIKNNKFKEFNKKITEIYNN